MATRKVIFLKFSTHKTQLATCKIIKQLATLKRQLATHNFISNSQYKFATRKITLQLCKKELATRKFIFLKLQLTFRNSQLAARKL